MSMPKQPAQAPELLDPHTLEQETDRAKIAKYLNAIGCPGGSGASSGAALKLRYRLWLDGLLPQAILKAEYDSIDWQARNAQYHKAERNWIVMKCRKIDASINGNENDCAYRLHCYDLGLTYLHANGAVTLWQPNPTPSLFEAKEAKILGKQHQPLRDSAPPPENQQPASAKGLVVAGKEPGKPLARSLALRLGWMLLRSLYLYWLLIAVIVFILWVFIEASIIGVMIIGIFNCVYQVLRLLYKVWKCVEFMLETVGGEHGKRMAVLIAGASAVTATQIESLWPLIAAKVCKALCGERNGGWCQFHEGKEPGNGA